MKKVLVLTLAIVVSASMAFAQGGQIGTFADTQGNDCNVSTAVPGLVTVRVVHLNAPGVTASQFKATMPACAAPTIWLSDTPVFAVTIGNSQSGVAIGYGACNATPLHILSISLFAQGAFSTCCVWPVTPDPAVPSGKIEVVDCGGQLIYGSGLNGLLNGDATCSCASVPTEETSWGAVKALYN